MKISAQKASEILGVSRKQISRLVEAGEIKSERFGNALQVDLDSVQRYQDLRPGRGRPLSAGAAWEMLASARPRNVDDLKTLAVAVRRRAERHEYRVLPAYLDRVLADQRVVISGSAAAVEHGAAVQDGPPHAIYVQRSDADQFVKDNRMRADGDDPNLIVRFAPDAAWVFNGSRHARMIVALVDLVDDRDDRSAAEALRAFA